MIRLREEVELAAAPDRVWPLLADPERVARCIPGATLSAGEDEGVWRGTLEVSLGPTRVTFRGRATLDYDHAARRCQVAGRGQDPRGTSKARAEGTVALQGEGPTRLVVDGGFEVRGPLAPFAESGGVHVARALLAEFANNLAAELEDERPARAPAPDEHLHGGRLLWRVLVTRIRAWIGRLRGARSRQQGEARDG